MKKTLSICVMLCAFFIAGCKSSNEPENQNNTPENQEFVDLGLPSGTLWKDKNELNSQDSNGLYNFEEAFDAFGKNMPTNDQFEELINLCHWLWTGSGYMIIGPNEKYINMPASGYKDKNNVLKDVGEYGCYWSCTLVYDHGNAYPCNLGFSKSGYRMDDMEADCKGSVRLVQSK